MRPAVVAIVEEVAANYNVTSDEIRGRTKTLTVARARRWAMWLVRQRLRMSYAEIGAEFGRKHASVHSAVKGLEREIARACA